MKLSIYPTIILLVTLAISSVKAQSPQRYRPVQNQPQPNRYIVPNERGVNLMNSLKQMRNRVQGAFVPRNQRNSPPVQQQPQYQQRNTQPAPNVNRNNYQRPAPNTTRPINRPPGANFNNRPPVQNQRNFRTTRTTPRGTYHKTAFRRKVIPNQNQFPPRQANRPQYSPPRVNQTTQQPKVNRNYTPPQSTKTYPPVVPKKQVSPTTQPIVRQTPKKEVGKLRPKINVSTAQIKQPIKTPVIKKTESKPPITKKRIVTKPTVTQEKPPKTVIKETKKKEIVKVENKPPKKTVTKTETKIEKKKPVTVGSTKPNYPLGKPSTKPNRAISPYEPYNELDVTGLSSGQLAIDPTTNMIFRVP